MHNFKELKIWQKAVDLAVKIYIITKDFPPSEIYGLTFQMRKSAVSISSNIAEGAGRNSNKEFVNFLSIANGSSSELLSQVIVANRVDLIHDATSQELETDIAEIQKRI